MTVRGIFVGTEETWSNVTHFSRTNGGGPDSDLDEVNVGDVDTAVETFYGSGFVSPLVEVSDWRFYVIGTNGKMEGNAPLLREYESSELRGGAGTTPYPPQVALAISTVAPNRGAAQFGRFFLPGPTRLIDSSFRISVSDAGTYVSLATQYLKDVSDAINVALLGSSECVHVSKGPVGSAEGTLQVVDHVRVGRVLDTIQSRRASLEEDYQVSGSIDW